MGVIIGISMMAAGLAMDVVGFIRINSYMNTSVFHRYIYQLPYTDHNLSMIVLIMTGFILFITGIIVACLSHLSAKRKKDLMSATVVVVKKFICPQCGVNLSTDCRKCPSCGKDVAEKEYC